MIIKANNYTYNTINERADGDFKFPVSMWDKWV